MMDDMPSTHSMITGWKTLIRCRKETISMAAMVATKVAIIQGMKISVGLAAFRDDRMAMILTGIRVSPEACRHRNMICELEAVVLSGFSSCRLSIAFKPKGVAALSSPSRLAEKFIIICPCAGCPLGTSGKSLEKKGPMILDNTRIPPARSAIFIKPMKRAMMPMSFKLRFTAVQQVSMMPSIFSGFAGSSALPTTIQLKISAWPGKKIHLIPATSIATMINPDHILLNAIEVMS